MRCALGLALACGVAAAAPPAKHATPSLERKACDPRPEGAGMASFDDAKRILHLRVVHADFGKDFGSNRCVALELELVDSFRGAGPEKIGQHLHLTVQQSTVTSYTSRPAGAWWVIEQNLDPGSELVAFCPEAGPASDQLREKCAVGNAQAALLGDLALAREVEAKHLDAASLVAKVRARCAGASYVLADLLLAQLGAAAAKDIATYDLLVTVLVDPACSNTMRGQLLDGLNDGATLTEDATRTRRLVRAMFHLLAMPEAKDFHDNIIEPYLVNLVGIASALPKRRASDIFTPSELATAKAALAAYKGQTSTVRLRAWLDAR
jgi:hypothetical protein